MNLADRLEQLRTGALGLAEQVEALCDRIDSLDARVQVFVPGTYSRERALEPGPGASPSISRSRQPAPPVRPVRGSQGHFSRGRLAHRLRLPVAAPAFRRAGSLLCESLEEGRRYHSWKNRHHGICLFSARPDPQPPSSGPHPGRIQQRIGRRGGGRFFPPRPSEARPSGPPSDPPPTAVWWGSSPASTASKRTG